MSYTKKYIITGAPGTGKTTLLEALKVEGYPCMDEVSRKVIKQEQQNDSNGTPWQDLSKFTELVFKAFVDELNGNPQATFTDRSPLDLIAYHLVEGMPIPLLLERFPYLDKFSKKAFFAPTWPNIFEPDEQRQQTFNYCMELEKALLTVHLEKGFEMITLPKDNVPVRVTFVRKFINNSET